MTDSTITISEQAARTLNPAEVAGLQSVDVALAQAIQAARQTQARVLAVQKERARIYKALGLDATKSYRVDGATGEVTEIEEAPGMQTAPVQESPNGSNSQPLPLREAHL